MTAPTLAAPVLTRDERVLLAAIHRWARQRPEGAYFPRWEPSYYPSWWKSSTATDRLAEVSWGQNYGGELHVEIRAGRYGERLLDETVRPRSVAEAVSLLVVWGILPREFLSPCLVGVETVPQADDECPGLPLPVGDFVPRCGLFAAHHPHRLGDTVDFRVAVA